MLRTYPTRLWEIAASHGTAPFCEIAGESGARTFSYAAFLDAVFTAAARIEDRLGPGRGRAVGILASRSWETYVAIGAVWRSGNHAVPLNPAFPPARLRELTGTTRTLAVLTPRETPLSFAPNLASTQLGDWLTLHELHPGSPPEETAAPELAYVIGSSGSTGRPKIIPVGWEQLASYREKTLSIYPFPPGTRFSQTFDLSFDPAIGDLFRAITYGGCLCPPTAAEALDLTAYVTRSRVDALFTVPSLAKLALQISPPTVGTLPWLRHVSFIGERLPPALAHQWQILAPQARIVNDYGPAECTVAVSTAVYDPQATGEVPIGRLSPGHEWRLRDGELLIHGPQVFAGYPESDGGEFLSIDGKKFYRTGDLAEINALGELVFVGRRDHQFKLGGVLVNPAEIEGVFLPLAGVTACAAIPWPRDADRAAIGIAVIIRGTPNQVAVKEAWRNLAEALPQTLVPKRVMLAPRWPVNQHGKADREQLVRWMDDQERAPFADLLSPQ